MMTRVVKTGVFLGVFWAVTAAAQTVWKPPAEIAPKEPEAQSAPTAAAPAADPKAAATAPAGQKKDKAKECKAQADAKGLHGKERKKFRDECVKS